MNEPELQDRTALAVYANTLGCRVGVEVGVHLGGHAAMMLNRCGLQMLYLIDPWTSEFYTRQMRGQKRMRRCRWTLRPYRGRHEMIRATSNEVVDRFPDGSIDWVYIDARHWHDYVLEDMRAWWPKVRDGGLFSGHDYYKRGNCGVIAAVHDFFTPLGRKWHVTTRGERHPTWWVVK